MINPNLLNHDRALNVASVVARDGKEIKLHDTRSAAAILGCSPALLARMRCEGRGPRYVRVGGKLCRYPESWLKEYLEANAVSTK